jgi:hypothetical protein
MYFYFQLNVAMIGFKINKYVSNISAKKSNFERRKKICESNNSTLISIHSAEENEFIRSYVEKHSTRVWIGLERNISGSHEFVWVDKSPVDYVNWSISQPDNFRGVEPYIEMLIDKNGSWNDRGHDNVEFVCGFNCKL